MPRRWPRRCMAAVVAAVGMPKEADAAAGRVAADGDEVLVRYEGRLQDGTVFDASGGSPFKFQLGKGQVVPGFDKAVLGLCIGQKVTVTLPPEEAYGKQNEQLRMTIPPGSVPADTKIGMRVMLGGDGGKRIPATVVSVSLEGSAVVDANPPLAGKTLTFDIELAGFREPTVRGMDMVGWGSKPLRVPTAIANSPVSQVFKNPRWPAAWPYRDCDFTRQDESDDVNFYDSPRFVAHIDDGAIASIRDFYAAHFAQAPQGEYSVLDICSSWISHYPEGLRAKRVAVTGMVEQELAANKQATEHVAKNLNKDPTLPYGDGEFDFVTNVVSVDYLSKPREVFKEMHRVLKPGGVAIMSFSNRCFPTKAIKMWVADMGDGPGHCQIVGNYFHFCPEGGFRDIASADISQTSEGNPMWVVTAVKA